MTFNRKTALEAGALGLGALVLIWYLKNHKAMTTDGLPVETTNQTVTDPSSLFAQPDNVAGIGTPSFDPGALVKNILDALGPVPTPSFNFDNAYAQPSLAASVPTAQSILSAMSGNDPTGSSTCGCGTGNSFSGSLTSNTPSPYTASPYVIAPGFIDQSQIAYPPIPVPPPKVFNSVFGQYQSPNAFSSGTNLFSDFL